jgi:hypothetical protein
VQFVLFANNSSLVALQEFLFCFVLFWFSSVCCCPRSLVRSLFNRSFFVCSSCFFVFAREKRTGICLCLFVCFCRGDGRVFRRVWYCGPCKRSGTRPLVEKQWPLSPTPRISHRVRVLLDNALSLIWQYLGSVGHALLDERERRLLCCRLTFWCQVLRKESGVEKRSCSLHHYYIHSLHLREWYCKILRNVNESRRKAFWRIDVDVRDADVRVSCSRRIVKKLDLWLLVFSLSLCVSLRLQSALPRLP